MEMLCSSFWFWFVVLGSFLVLLVAVFHWGWSLGKRNADFVADMRIKRAFYRWNKNHAADHEADSFHEECGSR